MLVERSLSGSLLEWRPHNLADALAHLGVRGFELEPLLHADHDSLQQLAEVEVTAAGLAWRWGPPWSHVEIRARRRGAADLVVRRRSDEPPYVDWEALADHDSAEVSFGAANGDRITLLKERPHPRATRRSHGGRVQLHVGAAGRAPLSARFYQQAGSGFTATSRQLPFHRAAEGWVCAVEDAPERGAVAVIQRRPSGERLIAGFAVLDRDVRERLTGPEAESLREAVEGRRRVISGGAWGARWPRESETRLDALFGRLRELHLPLPAPMPPERLTGAFRQLVLALCGGPARELSAQKVATLSRGELWSALVAVFPGLPPLDSVRAAKERAAEEKVWLLRHAQNDKAKEAFVAAAHHVEGSLDRSLAVVVELKKARDLVERWIPGCEEEKSARALVDAFEAYVGDGGDLVALQRELAKQASLFAELDQQNPRPDDPQEPRVKRLSDLWHRERQAMLLWRADLWHLLHFCASGAWRSPPSPPPAAELHAALLQLEIPPAPLQVPGPGEAADLRRLAEALLERHNQEPDKALRKLATARLRDVVLPHAERFPALHAEVRRAAERLQPFSWLRDQLRPPAAHSSLRERALAAQAALRLLDKLEDEARRWHGDPLLGAGNAQARLQVLATPDHPDTGEARARIERMREELPPSFSGVPGDSRQRSARAHAPRGAVAQLLEAWWADLHDLAQESRQVARILEDQRTNTRAMVSRVCPKVRELLRCQKSLPPAARRDYYAELSAAAAACCDPTAAPTPRQLHALLALLQAHPGWDRDWPAGRHE